MGGPRITQVPCAFCGKAFLPPQRRQPYCSRECSTASHVKRARAGMAQRFWSHVEKTDTCWNWNATLGRGGYGQFTVSDGVVRSTHRLAWELVNGEIPPGKHVLHHCDNRRCVRADADPAVSHLFLGTPADNTADMIAKGRGRAAEQPRRGEKHPRAKVTAEQVTEIRARASTGEGARSIGRAYGLSKTAVRYIVLGKTWRDDQDDDGGGR